MAEETQPDEESQAGDPNELASEQPRRKGVSTELRRFLGGPRTLKQRADSQDATDESDVSGTADVPARTAQHPEERQRAGRSSGAARRMLVRSPAVAAPPVDQPKPPRSRGAAIRVDKTTTRAVGFQHVALVLGGVLVLFCAFYVGKNYQYWKYLFVTRNPPKVTVSVADKFPDLGAQELIDQALVAENSGDWRGAVDRFVAAKHKDRAYRGLLFRAGKLLYDHQSFAVADQLFRNAIELGENLDAANYYRGLIATRNGDLAAAERFLSAATTAEPLIGYYHYSWAEALRLGSRPREAISKYEQAILRTANEQTRSVWRFKVRLTKIEAGELSGVKAAVDEKQLAGGLAVDWLLTAAALEVHQGRIEAAVRTINEARSAKHPGLFAECVRDLFFQAAAKRHRELAAAVHLDFDPNAQAFR